VFFIVELKFTYVIHLQGKYTEILTFQILLK